MPAIAKIDPSRIVIDKYLLETHLGRGSQSSVHVATNVQSGERVALKVVRDVQLATVEDRVRFEEEIRIVRQLDHPSIVKILDHGAPHSKQFIAMELIRGCDIELWMCGQPKLDRNEMIETLRGKRLPVFQKICFAIEYAHSQGIVHRDLKPSNILVDDADHPTVLDFGLARQRESPIRYANTEIRAFVGTKYYASPQQLKKYEADEQCDVFALGIILYMMVSDHHPYFGLNDTEVSDFWKNGQPFPTVRQRNKRAPAELDAIVQKATAWKQKDRYPTVSALRKDVERYLNGESITAKLRAPHRRAGWFLRRHRIKAACGLAACIAVTLIATISVRAAIREAALMNYNVLPYECKIHAWRKEEDQYFEKATVARDILISKIGEAQHLSTVSGAVTAMNMLYDSIAMMPPSDRMAHWIEDGRDIPGIDPLLDGVFSIHLDSVEGDALDLLVEIRDEMKRWCHLDVDAIAKHGSGMYKEWGLRPHFSEIRNRLPNLVPLMERVATLRDTQAEMRGKAQSWLSPL
ncbi:MAG: serine/threonine protein kinase [Phycisphaerae bacterium]